MHFYAFIQCKCILQRRTAPKETNSARTRYGAPENRNRFLRQTRKNPRVNAEAGIQKQSS